MNSSYAASKVATRMLRGGCGGNGMQARRRNGYQVRFEKMISIKLKEFEQVLIRAYF